MAEIYHLEKVAWTDADFANMSWHDCSIHAFSLNDSYELLLDIDYIFKWVTAGKRFKFWMSPCTLIFKNVYELEFDSYWKLPIIDSIEWSNPQKPKNAEYTGRDIEYDWNIGMVSGAMSFKSVGFDLHVRKQPILIREQKLTIEQRGDISFGKTYEVLKIS